MRNPRACSYVQGVIQQKDSTSLGTNLLKLVEAGATLDPPVIWVDAEGTRWVIDGHHRVEEMMHAGTPADRPIYVQRFLGATEAEARDFALTIGKRLHLNLHRSEALNGYWLGVLCGEVAGSIRGRAKQYGVSVSTVQRMDKQRAPVLIDLQAQALADGVEMDAAFIRTTAPVWKDLADWRDGEKGAIPDDPDRKAVERMLRTLTIRFSDQAKAQPDVLLQAFQEFFEEVTGTSPGVEAAE